MPGKRAGGAAAKGHHNRRDEVLEAAVDIFHAKGYPSASIQDVADRVGVLKGSLYHYIDSKEDLLANVFEGSDRQSEQVMALIEETEGTAIERLRLFVYEWSLWHMVNLERASIYFKEWQHLKGNRLASVKRKRREYEDFLHALLEAVKLEGEVGSDLDLRYIGYLTLSAINGLPSWYRRGGRDSAEYIANSYAAMVVGMVRAEPR